jgi:phytoene dehydrogenase-like protein
MSTYDVIIIGAGANGLVAGAYLARGGLKTLLLEKNTETGGGLVTQEVCGFRLNHHATYMLLGDLMPCVSELNLKDSGVRFITPEVQMAFLLDPPYALLFFTHAEDSAKSIAEISPADAERFLTMWKEFELFFERFLLPATYHPPLDPLAQTEKLQNSDELGKRLARISEMTPVEVLDEYGFQNPHVRGALLYTVSMFGIEPDEALGFLVPIYILRVLRSALMIGGTHFLASVLRTIVERSGGEVRTSSEVQSLWIEGSRVRGVILSSGERIEGRAVLSTLPPPFTFDSLLPEGTEDSFSELKEIAKRWEWEPVSLFVVHRGIAGPPLTYPGYPAEVARALNVVMGYRTEEDVLQHFQEVREGRFSPRGHGSVLSLFDPLLIPRHVNTPPHHLLRWESWAPYEFDWSLKKKKEIARECWAVWESYCPAIKESCTIVEIPWSPQDIERHVPAMVRGSIKHGAYLPLQMGYNRPDPECSSYRTPIPGLYVGGASVHPGGMVIIGPGYNSARVICEDLGGSWPGEELAMVKEAKERGYL